MMPIQVISRPDAHHERMVMSDFRPPTAKCATRLIPNEAITASRPPEKKNGMIGTNAPIAVEMPADNAALHWFGTDAQTGRARFAPWLVRIVQVALPSAPPFSAIPPE